MAQKLVGAVTYFPAAGVYVQGEHEDMPSDARILGASNVKTIPAKDPNENPTYKMETQITDPGLYAAASMIAKNKTRIRAGQLSAADIRIGGAELDPLVLVRLHDQIMGEQMRWFHLDAMFNEMKLDQLVKRMTFKDNIASVQEVPERTEYDITKMAYDDINFYLTKLVAAYDISIEDKLRATLDPVSPLQQSNDYAMAYQRERRAARALANLKYIYDKSATAGSAFTTTTTPAGKIPTDNRGSSGVSKNLGAPLDIATGGVHSKNRIANEIQIMKNLFMEENDLMLTHGACSPNTAMEIAQNTWTQPNTIFSVEAYRTNGGTRPFPGVSETTMVISQILPDNVIFWSCKPSGVLTKAEGPKISKAWEDNNKFTNVAAQLDFNQYKCAHEDLDTNKLSRKFGCISLIDEGVTDLVRAPRTQ